MEQYYLEQLWFSSVSTPEGNSCLICRYMLRYAQQLVTNIVCLLLGEQVAYSGFFIARAAQTQTKWCGPYYNVLICSSSGINAFCIPFSWLERMMSSRLSWGLTTLMRTKDPPGQRLREVWNGSLQATFTWKRSVLFSFAVFQQFHVHIFRFLERSVNKRLQDTTEML